MAFDASVYERSRRGIEDDFSAKNSANTFGRFTSQQRFSRDQDAFTRDFRQAAPKHVASFGRRGMVGPNGQSGVYQQAMSDFVGGYNRNLGYRQQDQQFEQEQFNNTEAQLAAQRSAALAQLEMDKTNSIAQAALEIQQLRQQYS